MAQSLSIVGQEENKGSCGIEMNIKPGHSGVEPRAFQGRAAVITLGCAKNQVDSEVMLGVLKNSGFELVPDVAEADVAIVNTCGFLESAVKESVDCILDVSELKTSGRLRQLIVAGCLVSRYKGDLAKTLPEVDHFLTTEEILKVGVVAGGSVVEDVLDKAARPYFLYDDSMPRCLSTRSHTAYVKIAEGCDRPCTFCIIPKIRGKMRSRSIDSVVREVQELGQQGVQEVNLVAQDLTSYGADHKEGGLVELLQALSAADAVKWIRLLYAYPIGTEAVLLDTIRKLPNVCNYIDIPLQHSSERVLKEMRRPLGRFSPRKLVEFIRSHAPEIQIRTTFIVGFPGETEEDVADLEAFIRDGHFTSVGIFCYSKEQGTPAGEMKNQVAKRTQESRRKRLMKAQQEVVGEKLQSFVGQTLDVLIEGLHEETELLLTGRTAFQAPEVDGVVLINDIEPELGEITPGRIGRVEITEVAGYDLIGTLISY